MIILKKKILAITAGLLTAMALTACGKDPKLTPVSYTHLTLPTT